MTVRVSGAAQHGSTHNAQINACKVWTHHNATDVTIFFGAECSTAACMLRGKSRRNILTQQCAMKEQTLRNVKVQTAWTFCVIVFQTRNRRKESVISNEQYNTKIAEISCYSLRQYCMQQRAPRSKMKSHVTKWQERLQKTAVPQQQNFVQFQPCTLWYANAMWPERILSNYKLICG